MPSVGMRRSTRVFGARLLRSGRKLLTGPGPGPGDRKYIKASNGDYWIGLVKNSGVDAGGGNQRKERGRHGYDVVPKQEITEMDVDERVVDSAPDKIVVHEGGVVADNHIGRRRWGVVYSRKRKNLDFSLVESPVNGNKKRNMGDKRFGKQYFRRKWRKRTSESWDGSNVCLVDNARCHFLIVVFDSSCGSSYLVTCFLNSVLRYMKRARISLLNLFAFVHSKLIASIYSSRGIRFLQGCNLVAERGVVIWGSNCFIPIFAVDYSALPYCFVYLHSRMLLHFAHTMYSLGLCSVGIDEKDDVMTILPMPTETVEASDVLVAFRSDNSEKMEMSPSNAGATKFAGLNLRPKNDHNIQKRSSLRSKRGRRPSSFGARKANGVLTSNLFSLRHNGSQRSPIAARRGHRSSVRRHNATNVKQLKSAMVSLRQDVDPTCCSANLLVMDSDKSSREEGAIVTLEVSEEKRWHLAIKRDGMDRYSVITENFMRPCSFNRFTHAIMWGTESSSWKLEFADRRDWLIFKELYKKCSDRNAQVPVECSIPVPGVCEVSGYVNSSSFFLRPASYISVKDNELSRALARSTANYDMDSDDEEWLNNFNSKVSSENEFHELLSAENFEMVIDAFERGFHCNPDDFSDETTIPNICLDLERKVLEAVYSFWIKKRKQRRSALVRIFQLYQPRRTQLIPNTVLRKKRSFKRQASQIGRGKQRPFLKEMMAAKQDALQQQNAVVKVEEAKAAANRSEGLAVLKRQRAQQLMENADLATYKATMALRIAELAQTAESTDAVSLLFPVK